MIDDEHGVVAAPREVDDALGVLDPDVVAVGIVDQVGLVRGQVGEGGIVGGAVTAEWSIVEGVRRFGDVSRIFLESGNRTGSLFDPADEVGKWDGSFSQSFRVLGGSQTGKEAQTEKS